MRVLIAIRTQCTTLIARATTRRAVAGTLSTACLFALLLAVNPSSSDAKVAEHVTVPDLLLDLRNAKPLPAPSHADSVAAERELPVEVQHARLEQYFRRFTTDARMAGRVSRAVVRYARAHDVPPSLVAAVLVTENRTLKPRAESSVGARGLMQVMPFHAGMKGCPSADLVNVENNICHGTRILRDVLDRAQTTRGALLRYNGCRNGTNTPDCWKYPRMVLTRAGRVRQLMLTDTRAFEPEPPPVVGLLDGISTADRERRAGA